MSFIQYASKPFISKRPTSTNVQTILKPSAPVLALCGDIGSPFCERTQKFIEWCGSQWDKVLWVPGVEEWSTQLNSNQTMRDVPYAMAQIIPKKVLPLINSSWLWKKGDSEVLFLGTTLWGPCRFTSTKESQDYMYQNVKELQSLYYRPYNKETLHRFNHTQVGTANKQAVQWLKYQVDDSREEDKTRPIVILSYTAPSIAALGNKDKYDLPRLAMRNHLDRVLNRPVSIWLYGDAKQNFSYTDPITNIYYSSNSGVCPTGFGPQWTVQVRSNWFPPVRTSTLLSTAPSLALPFDE